MKDLVVLSSSVVDHLNMQPPPTPNGQWSPLRCDFRCVNALEVPLDGTAQKFDCIHFGAALDTVPDIYLNCLAPGGRLLVPLGESEQKLTTFDRSEDGKVITQTEHSDTTFASICKTRNEQWVDQEARLRQLTVQVCMSHCVLCTV